MARIYSNKTLDALARFVDCCFTHTEMSSLFLYVSVPDDFDHGLNKLARSLGILKKLSRSDEQEHHRILDELVDEVIARRSDFFKRGDHPRTDSDERAASLKRALQADSYDIVDGQVLPVDKLETELATEMSLLDKRLRSRGMTSVIRTLDQAHQNFIDGNFEACNAMLRTSLEGTLKHIASGIAGSPEKIAMGNVLHGPSPVDVRKFLHQKGFFAADEINFIKEFYGYSSTDGSHPGLSSESESRLRRLMIVALIQYCLEKLESSPSSK